MFGVMLLYGYLQQRSEGPSKTGEAALQGPSLMVLALAGNNASQKATTRPAPSSPKADVVG